MDQNQSQSAPIAPVSTLNATDETLPMRTGTLLNTKETMDNSEDSVDENDQEDYKDEEDSRDDEDFIVSSSPKLKKRPPNKTPTKFVKKKRICDFCGCSDTPMWRRGPQGKGTLCNACGVKWSLKARKRTNKKKDKGSNKEPFTLKLGSNPTEPTEPTSSNDQNDEELKEKGSARTKLMFNNHKRKRETDEVKSDIKEYYCKYCGLTWPEKHFKNTQQFGAHCSNCSRKQPRTVDDSSLESEKEGKKTTLKEGKKVVKQSRTSQKSAQQSTGDDTNVNGTLGKLLNVVENQLLEEEELEDLRKQLSNLRDELVAKEEERKKKLEEARSSALNELMEFRREMVALIASKEVDFNAKIESLGMESITDVKMQLRLLIPLVSEIHNAVCSKGDCDGDLEEQLKGILSQVSSLHQKIEAQFGAIRLQFADYAHSMCEDLNQKVESVESKLKHEAEQLQREFNNLNSCNSLALLEEVLSS